MGMKEHITPDRIANAIQQDKSYQGAYLIDDYIYPTILEWLELKAFVKLYYLRLCMRKSTTNNNAYTRLSSF